MALEFPAFFHYATPHSYANAHRTYFNIHSCIQVSLSHSLIANESDNNKTVQQQFECTYAIYAAAFDSLRKHTRHLQSHEQQKAGRK